MGIMCNGLVPNTLEEAISNILTSQKSSRVVTRQSDEYNNNLLDIDIRLSGAFILQALLYALKIPASWFLEDLEATKSLRCQSSVS